MVFESKQLKLKHSIFTPTLLSSLRFSKFKDFLFSLNCAHLLQSNETKLLTDKFLHARETEQRMNADLIKIDSKLIYEFKNAVNDIDEVFREISGKLESVRDVVNEMANEIKMRVFFHKRWGVEKVKVSTCTNHAYCSPLLELSLSVNDLIFAIKTNYLL